MGRWIENSLIQILISEKRSSMPASVAREGGKYKFFVSSHESLLSDYYSYIGEYLVVGNGGVANVHYVNGKFGVSSHSLLYSVKESNDTVFWYYKLYNSLETIFYKCFEGSGLKNLNSNKFYNLQFHYPESLNEQRRIAQILSKVDEAIDSTQSLIDKHELIKEGMMHDLFTRGIDPATGSLRPHPSDAPGLYKNSELGLIPKEWEVKRLGSIIHSLNAGVSVNSEDKTIGLGEKGVLKTSALSNGVFDYKQHKTALLLEVHRLSVPVIGDSILISRMNTPDLVGANAYVFEGIPNIFLPDRLWQIKLIEQKKNNTLWLSYVFNRLWKSGQFSEIATGTSATMKNISKFNLLSIKILLPNPFEQELIAKIVHEFNSNINNLSQKKQKLLLQKQGMMQDLLSGKVRVM